MLLGVSSTVTTVSAALGAAGEPGEFDEATGLEAEEVAVVGMALSLEVGRTRY